MSEPTELVSGPTQLTVVLLDQCMLQSSSVALCIRSAAAPLRLRFNYTRYIQTTMTPSMREPPEGYRVHRESTTEILVPSNTPKEGQSARSQVFINPIQEFNRDLSVLALQTWSDILALEKQKKHVHKKGKAVTGRKRKLADTDDDVATGGEPAVDEQVRTCCNVGELHLKLTSIWSRSQSLPLVKTSTVSPCSKVYPPLDSAPSATPRSYHC